MPFTPATELANKATARFPHETSTYRAARNQLLAEEIELRRHIERVAEQRRALPLGGAIPKNYPLISATGPIHFSDLFAGKRTLVVYSMMYGPQRDRPCPMCTAMLSSWNGAARNFAQNAELAVFARSPIERLLAWKAERHWTDLQFISDTEGSYTRTYVDPNDGDVPALNIFQQVTSPSGNTIHHFWSGEFTPAMADPGQDPRSAPELDPLWTLLDLTPEGRGAHWYPQLDYTPQPLTQLK